MDNDEEGFINFKVTSDDLEFELDPRSSRRQTKDEAIYGIWARDEEKRQKYSKSAFSSGINFVSGGVSEPKDIEAGNSDEAADDNKDDVITDSENDEDDFRPASSSLRPESNAKDDQQRRAFGAVTSQTAYRASREFGNWQKYTKGIGYKLLDKMGYIPGKGLGRSNQGIVNPVAAKKRKGKAGVGANGPERENEEEDFVTDAGGRQQPNQMAASDNQKRQWRKTKAGEKKANYKFVTVDDLRRKALTTKTADFSALGNVKVIDRTGPETKYLHGYDELARQYKRPASDDELSDGEIESARSGFGAQARMPTPFGVKSAFHMPELMHNINKIVESVEQQIIKADQTALRSEDKIAHLRYEEDRLSTQFNEEEDEISRLSEVIERLKTLESQSRFGGEDGNLSFKDLTDKFVGVKQQFPTEFVLYELHNFTIALVFPKAKVEINNWDMSAESPSDCVGPVKEFEAWKDILKDNKNSQNIYAHMIWDIWMPKVRRYILSNSIRSSERLIEILEAWSPLLPKNIFINIVEQFLIPRLQEALDSWNPVSDTVPVHSWIHPWLPLLGDRLQPLFVTIRTKLAQCLVNWDPTDRSAKMIIEPWRDVFSKGEMEAFLIKAICPKLKMALHLMPLDNTSSGIELLRSVLIWHDLLSLHQLSQILVAHFFPKWIQCLCVWLSNQPNFDEVEKWYRAWRNEFPIQLLALNETKASFKQAMDMMTRSVSGSSVMGYEYVTPIPQHPGPPTHNMGGMPQHQYHPYNNSAHHPIYNYNIPATAADGYVPHSILRLQQQSGVDSSSASMMQLDTFRDLVERRCSELNLLFAPVPGVFHDSRQVYTLGTVKVCIDKGVLFVNKGGGGTKWQPMALPAVLSYAKDR